MIHLKKKYKQYSVSEFYDLTDTVINILFCLKNMLNIRCLTSEF